MMIKVVVVAVAITLLAIILKNDFKAGATLLSAAGCLLIFSMSVGLISAISESFDNITFSKSINSDCIEIIIKMLAVAYTASFGADICSDAGEKALSNAVECFGKLTMLAMAFPMLTAIFNSIADMIG